MKLASALAATAVLVVSVVQGGSTYYSVPVSNFAPGNNLSTDAIATSLHDSSYYTVPVGDLTPSNLTSDAIVSSLKTTSIVPKGTKTYVAGLRRTAGGNNLCGASLITPTHLLTGTYCASANIRWASIGSNFVNGTEEGEQIKIVTVLNHPKSSNANFSSDLAIFVLEKPSSFKPVALSAADGSDVDDGEAAAKLGWDDTGGKDTMADNLTRENVQLMSQENCLKETSLDDSMLCSRGTSNVTSCTGDYGGPVVVERPSGDIVVGVLSWGDDCDKLGYPSIYSRVSSARTWIDSVASGVCFH